MLWDALQAGSDCLTRVPQDRWHAARFLDRSARRSDRIVSDRGGFIEGLAAFDAAFFGLSAREAAAMDPQQRHFLEVSYEAIEDACLNPLELAGSKVGVFVGASGHDYSDLQQRSASASVHTNTGAASSMIANRVSFHLDLRGPSLTIDTACSSSSVAMHLACESLRRAECSLAVVGGVSLVFNPNLSIGFSVAGMLSADGASKPFDSSANGYVRGEGVGAVLIAPLSEARARGLDVYALVVGSAVGQDGKTKAITQPNPDAQVDILRETYARLALAPQAVDYVEAHGTGTVIGDRMEATALAAAFTRDRDERNPLRIGSLKGNLGHLEAASGIVSVIKLALCLRRRAWVPSIRFEAPPGDLPLEAMKLSVQRVVERWNPSAGVDAERRLAGINSFGFGGTNAHLVLAESEVLEAPGSQPSRPAHWSFPVSARTPGALALQHDRLLNFLRGHPRVELADVSNTLCTRRPHHRLRGLYFAGTRAGLMAQLEATLAEAKPATESTAAEPSAAHPLVGSRRRVPWRTTPDASQLPPTSSASSFEATPGELRAEDRVTVFTFSGQGGHWGAQLERIRQLYRHADGRPLRQVVEEIATTFDALGGWSLVDLFEGRRNAADLDETRIVQPFAFAVQVGLARCWRARGVEPEVVLGHSMGEVAAAHIAGVYELADAARIVHHRSRLQHATSRDGRMLALVAPETTIEALLADQRFAGLTLAARNATSQWTLAASAAVIAAIARELSEAKIVHRILDIRHAFHGPLMDPIRDELLGSLEGVRPRPSSCRLYSSVAGECLPWQRWSHHYWWANVREPVRFHDAVRRIIAEARTEPIWIELGPAALQGMFRDGRSPRDNTTYVATLPNVDPETAASEAEGFDAAVRRAFCSGVVPTWPRHGNARTALRLPSYGWDHHRHWQEPACSKAQRLSTVNHPWLSLLGAGETDWLVQVSLAQLPLLRDHVIAGAPTFPAAAYVDLLLAMPVLGVGNSPGYIEDVEFRQALRVPRNEDVTLRLEYLPAEERFTFTTTEEGQRFPTLHCRGRLRRPPTLQRPEPLALEEVRQRYPVQVSARNIYLRLERIGLIYGPGFRALREALVGEGEALVKICLDAERCPDLHVHPLHPSYLDACFQAALLTLPAARLQGDHAALPVAIGAIEVFATPTRTCWAKAVATGTTLDEFVTDLFMYDETGQPVARVRGFVARAFHNPTAARARDLFYNERFIELSTPPLRVAKAPATMLVVVAAPAPSAQVVQAVAAAVEPATHTLWVLPAAHDAPTGGDTALIELATATGSDRLATELEAREFIPDTVVFVVADPLEQEATRRQAAFTPASALSRCGTFLNGIRALGRVARDRALRVLLFTRNARMVEQRDIPNLGDGALWGAARVALTEHPGWTWRCVDLDSWSTEQLREALLDDSAETELAYRGARRWACRLEQTAAQAVYPAPDSIEVHPGAERVQLHPGSTRRIDGLVLRHELRREPGPGEVEVEVRAATLNFRDVMKAMGVYPATRPDDVELGDECAGVVVRVGPGVSLEVGQHVLALAPGSMASFVTCPEQGVFIKPPGISFAEASGIAVAGITAHYALHELARLRAGECVLVHAAAGGVGSMAVQLAQRVGARVLATAGSDSKRAFLQALGVRDVFDSRRLDFFDEVRAASGGVDVVINSLAGDPLRRSIELLRPFGRFVELGKVDIHRNTALGLRSLRDNISLFAVDLVQLFALRPGRTRAMMQELLSLVARAELKVFCGDSFRIDEAVSAFRHVSQAKHIGKVALTIPDSPVRVTPRTRPPLAPFRQPGTCIVTGGTRGFGFATARRLVEGGARSLVLIGKTGQLPPDVAAEVERMRTLGVNIEVAACDVADRPELERLLTRIRASHPPIRVVAHAAMCLKDSSISNFEVSAVAEVFGPKAVGAWNLHLETLDDPLEYFVAFGSVTTQLGGVGQAVYAAANASLEALAQVRRRSGRPALTVSLGPLAEVGVVANDSNLAQQLERQGLWALAPCKALDLIALLSNRDEPHAIVADIEWRVLSRVAPHACATPRVASVCDAHVIRRSEGTPLGERLVGLSRAEQERVLREALANMLTDVLQLDPARLDDRIPLRDLGLDSLGMMELQTFIQHTLGLSLSAEDFTESSNLETLLAVVLRKHKVGQ